MTTIDNITHYPTPEGLVLQLAPAGFMVRAFAWAIDAIVRGIAIAICSFFCNLMGELGMGLLLIVSFLITWLYPVYFEVWRDGMTIGKKYYNIYVCHDDGTPINLSSSMIRNLLRAVDSLPFFYAIGMVSSLFNKKSQRLGDMVAGTIVVYKDKDDISNIVTSMKRLSQIQEEKQQINPNDYNQADPLFHFPLTLTEQQALLSFSDRLIFLPLERQQEICSHLNPLVENPSHVHTAVLARAKQIKGNYQGVQKP